MTQQATSTGTSYRKRYVLLALLFAAGSPLGYLALRVIQEGVLPTATWIGSELGRAWILYLYLTLTTSVALACLGWYVGGKEDTLKTLSVTDALTGLLNRRAFNTLLTDELKRAQRYKSSLSLLLIDLDRLKTINDQDGHNAGDEALRAVGEAMREVARSTDTLTRVGGDEFAIIAPSTSAGEACVLGDRLRHALARFSVGTNTLAVSIGISDMQLLQSIRPEALVMAADEALYTAKANGRDCVRVANVKEGSRRAQSRKFLTGSSVAIRSADLQAYKSQVDQAISSQRNQAEANKTTMDNTIKPAPKSSTPPIGATEGSERLPASTSDT